MSFARLLRRRAAAHGPMEALDAAQSQIRNQLSKIDRLEQENFRLCCVLKQVIDACDKNQYPGLEGQGLYLTHETVERIRGELVITLERLRRGP